MTKLKHQRFTLIEMLIVLIIALILAGMILAANAAIQRKAEETKATAQLEKINVALNSYYQDYGEYPNAASFPNGELTIVMLNMLRDPNGKLYVEWETTEDMTDASDPWGKPYLYYRDSTIDPCPKIMNKKSFDIWSRGPDEGFGANDGGGSEDDSRNFNDNDDITNWKN